MRERRGWGRGGETGLRDQRELMGELIITRHREFGIGEEEALSALDTVSGANHVSATTEVIGVLAQIHLFDAEKFDTYFDALTELNRRRFQPFSTLSLTLALRAWALESQELAEQAREHAMVPYRNARWVATEVLLEHLGVPLSPAESQWLESYDVVRDRWLKLLESVLDRARGAAR